jgi:hypothetical protein
VHSPIMQFKFGERSGKAASDVGRAVLKNYKGGCRFPKCNLSGVEGESNCYRGQWAGGPPHLD